MATSSPGQSFAALVKDTAENYPWMLSTYEKVTGVLKFYAARRELSLTKLTLIHLCHDRDRTKLCPSLITFIDNLPNSKVYKSEIKSRLRRILKALSALPMKGATVSGPAPLLIPEVLNKLLPALPRQDTWSCIHKKRIPCTDEQGRMARPLTELGQGVLAVLIQVVEKNKITELDTLFSKHLPEIMRTVRATQSPSSWNSMDGCIRTAFKRIGYRELRAPRQSIDYSEWPPTLRRQFGRLEELAPLGIGYDSELTRQSVKYEFKVKPLNKTTLKNYRLALSNGIYHIFSQLKDKPADLDVRDLLRLQRVSLEGVGRRRSISLNPLVEHYRRRELARGGLPTGSKINTPSFSFFIYAVRAVALYNGYFELYSRFAEAYNFTLDKQERQAKKNAKKDIFDLAWIDAEIARLLVDFRRIIKERSFRLESYTGPSFSGRDRHRNIRFCLFFVILVTLRYMGHRQQSLRNCEVGRGKNVEFLDDGSIHFNWKSELVKTDVELDQVIQEWEHQTHAIMVEVLTSYYKVIYRPYILRHSAAGPNGENLVANQLFVYIDPAGKFRRFDEDDQGTFAGRFSDWSLQFIEYGGRANVLGRGLHPHYFRGLAIDWMVNERKVPLEKAAEYFGISVRTLIRDYLRANPKKSAAPALEAANAKRKAEAAKEREETLQKRLKDNEAAHKEELARKDKMLEEKDRRIYELQDQLIDALKKKGAAWQRGK
jgi:hypothetical protein